MAKPAASALADGDTGQYDTAEAAAVAGLRSIKEHKTEVGGGVLYNPDTKKYAYTQPVGQGDGYHFGASVQVPNGWELHALFHTHPPGPSSTQFSADDVNMANQLKVPSYILPRIDDTVRRFDPGAKTGYMGVAAGMKVNEAQPVATQQPPAAPMAATVQVSGSSPDAPQQTGLTDAQKSQLADLYDEAQRTGDQASMGRIRSALLADRQASSTATAAQPSASPGSSYADMAASTAQTDIDEAQGLAKGKGVAEIAGAGLLNTPGAALNGFADLESRFFTNKPYQGPRVPSIPVGQAGQDILSAAGDYIPASVKKLLADHPTAAAVSQDVASILGGASLAASVANKVANGIASQAEIAAARPAWARAGFTSDAAAAGHELGLRNGLDNPIAGYLTGSAKRELLTNNNADVGNAIARRAARVDDEVAPGVATPLTKEALDKALEPMEAVYQRAAAGLPQGDQVLAKLRQLRHDGFAAMGSEDPQVIAQGRSLLQEADGLERFIEKNISPTSGTSLEQLRAARQAIAQNRTVYDALSGEDIDLLKLGRVYRNGPTNYFADGPLKTLARWADDNRAVAGARIKGADTTLRQGVEGGSAAFDLTKPASWPQVARVTGLPQRAVRGPGVSQTLKTLTPRDPNEFAPQPMRGLSPPPGQVGVLPQQGALPFGQAPSPQ